MKKKLLDSATAQAEINEIQEAYSQWCALLPKLEAIHSQWQQGAELVKKMESFYFDGKYSQYCDAIEEGKLDVNLHTKDGEYSVMSEDALWSVFHEQQRIAWQMLRSSIAVLDKEDVSS